MNKTARQAERVQHQQRMADLHTQAQTVVATGRCPQCGTPLIRNLALAGWWQCGGYAAASHRRPEFAAVPKCDFQTFTE